MSGSGIPYMHTDEYSLYISYKEKN
jgi:hypothetical protein